MDQAGPDLMHRACASRGSERLKAKLLTHATSERLVRIRFYSTVYMWGCCSDGTVSNSNCFRTHKVVVKHVESAYNDLIVFP